MKLETFQYTLDKGWSIRQFPPFDSENTLILVFAAPEFMNNPSAIHELKKAYPQSQMIGCSTAGEIAGPSVYDHTLSVAVIIFEKTKFKIVKTKMTEIEKSYECGSDIAKQLNDPELNNIFVLSEGLNVNGTELVQGINASNKKKVTVTGGLSGDGQDFKQTWTMFKGDIHTNYIVAAGFYGNNIHIGHASRGGWDIFGPERRITRSKNNILYELDDKPALSLYKDYLGERASGLPATGLLYPLAIRANNHDNRQLVRTILAIDEEQQSLTFAGDIPMGYLGQLMRANFDRLIASATEAGDIAIKQIQMEQNSSSPILSVAVSCVGRRLLLGERIDEETESLFDTLPPGSHQIGFYSYGELSPHTVGDCDLHNQTMTITTFSES